MKAKSLCPMFQRELSWGRGLKLGTVLVPQLFNSVFATGPLKNAKPKVIQLALELEQLFYYCVQTPAINSLTVSICMVCRKTRNMQSKDQNRLWVHLAYPLHGAPNRWHKFPRYTCLMALSYLRKEWGFLPANGAAKKEREMSHWDSSFYLTNNSVNTWHVSGIILDPRNTTMNKIDKFPQFMVWWWLLVPNPILPVFPALFPPGLSFSSSLSNWSSSVLPVGFPRLNVCFPLSFPSRTVCNSW